MRGPLVLAGAMLLVGCSGSTSRPAATVVIPQSAVDYFPPGALALPDRPDDDFVPKWYGKHLLAMNEPSLWQAARASIRFTMLPSFWKPISVRIDLEDGGGATLTATRLDGRGGYDPGKIEYQTTTTLAARDVATLQKLFDDVSFDGMPARIVDGIFDGAEYIVERTDGRSYHVVTRTSPDDATPYDVLCKTILHLAPPELVVKRRKK